MCGGELERELRSALNEENVRVSPEDQAEYVGARAYGNVQPQQSATNFGIPLCATGRDQGGVSQAELLSSDATVLRAENLNRLISESFDEKNFWVSPEGQAEHVSAGIDGYVQSQQPAADSGLFGNSAGGEGGVFEVKLLKTGQSV